MCQLCLSPCKRSRSCVVNGLSFATSKAPLQDDDGNIQPCKGLAHPPPAAGMYLLCSFCFSHAEPIPSWHLLNPPPSLCPPLPPHYAPPPPRPYPPCRSPLLQPACRPTFTPASCAVWLCLTGWRARWHLRPTGHQQQQLDRQQDGTGPREGMCTSTCLVRDSHAALLLLCSRSQNPKIPLLPDVQEVTLQVSQVLFLLLTWLLPHSPPPGQHVLERTAVLVSAGGAVEARFTVGLPAQVMMRGGGSGAGHWVQNGPRMPVTVSSAMVTVTEPRLTMSVCL